MCWRSECRRKNRSISGQATVEAAVGIPIAFLLLLLLAQPAIIMYDRLVMENAAMEACRLMCTAPEEASVAEDYVRRRLSAVPQMDLFHMHEGGCSWDIQLSCTGNVAHAAISTKVRPLPLLGGLGRMAGLGDAEGLWDVRVEEQLPMKAAWQ